MPDKPVPQCCLQCQHLGYDYDWKGNGYDRCRWFIVPTKHQSCKWQKPKEITV